MSGAFLEEDTAGRDWDVVLLKLQGTLQYVYSSIILLFSIVCGRYLVLPRTEKQDENAFFRHFWNSIAVTQAIRRSGDKVKVGVVLFAAVGWLGVNLTRPIPIPPLS